jgi:glycosyltransferase involved in cell wall biosynthesis
MKSRPSQTQESSNQPPIVWDGLGLSNRYSGIGYYGHQLYEAMALCGEQPFTTTVETSEPWFVPAEKRLPLMTDTLLNGGIQARILPKAMGLKPIFPNISYGRSQQLAAEIIYHGLSNINLPTVGRKRPNDRFIITIHDLIPLILDKSSLLALQMQILLPCVLSRADAIIAPSSWTKNLLAEKFGAEIFEKIIVIPNGTRTTIKMADSFSKNSSAKTKDVLIVARGERYKRLVLVKEVAFALKDHSFALVTDEMGKRQIGDPPPNLRVYTKVNDIELEALFQGSKVLLHPSLYEGWCLPAADALVRGLHVVYCSGSGIDDVCRHSKSQTTGLSREQSWADWIDATKVAVESFDNRVGEPILLPTWLEAAEKTLKIYQSLV